MAYCRGMPRPTLGHGHDASGDPAPSTASTPSKERSKPSARRQGRATPATPGAAAGRAVPAAAVPGPPGEPHRAFLGVSYAFGIVAGLVLGVYGVVLVPSGPRPGGALISIGLLLALFGNTGVPFLVRWLTGTRLGAMIPLVGWIPVVLLLASSRTEGDLLLKATATGYLFLGIGVFAPVVVAVFGQARRGLTALPPRPPTVPPR
ncbi:hypothetical protein Franean1_0867 [Parafrankia sp. EAN1pec]|nr:hypothetical protein Franean1_0867 [Frankia sp. EAN1pec]